MTERFENIGYEGKLTSYQDQEKEWDPQNFGVIALLLLLLLIFGMMRFEKIFLKMRKM